MADGKASEPSVFAKRAVLAALGGAAGLGFWLIAEKLSQHIENPQALLFVALSAGGYFASLLGLAGALPIGRAALAAFPPSVFAAALMIWASLRYETLGAFSWRLEHMAAYLIVAALPLPFLAAALSGQGWRYYPTLFNESWALIVRLLAAALFAGVVWIGIFLADELLRMAGISLLADLMRTEAVPEIATGIIAGLALGIVKEMEDVVSARLVLGLLRLLILPAFLVVALFLAAIPAQGLAGLSALASPATTLLAIAAALTVLVSVAADAHDAYASRSPAVAWPARGLALLLPALALLALYALRLRIEQHGLSPGRIAAGMAGAVLLAYGLFYVFAVLSGARWRERVREGNTWMALAVFAFAALWLTPAIHAERISAEHLAARLASGEVAPDKADLWALSHDWGRAGEAVFARLEAQAAADSGAAVLRERLALARAAPERTGFDATPERAQATVASRDELQAMLPIVPPGKEAVFDRFILPWYAGSVAPYLEGCKDPTTSGAPGCVLVVADLLPESAGEEAILFYKSFGLLRGEVIVAEPFQRRAQAAEIFGQAPPDFRESDRIIEELQAGNFTAGPARINAITVGERQFTLPF
jgi:hypothetical protein